MIHKLFELTLDGKVVGYRIYERFFDTQVADTVLDVEVQTLAQLGIDVPRVVNKLPLQIQGDLLLTEDELKTKRTKTNISHDLKRVERLFNEILFVPDEGYDYEDGVSDSDQAYLSIESCNSCSEDQLHQVWVTHNQHPGFRELPADALARYRKCLICGKITRRVVVSDSAT